MTPTTPSAELGTVVGRHEAHVAQLRSAVLVPDPHDEPAMTEHIGERLEHRDAVFQELDDGASPLGVVELGLREQRRHAHMVEPIAVGLGKSV